MFFKNGNKTENQLKGLYAGIDELISQRRYLPYMAGDIRSAFKGRGMELEEVRAYGYGDDVRDIDWRVTARKGDTYTKIFSEEKDREVYAVLDLSPYMLFGTRIRGLHHESVFDFDESVLDKGFTLYKNIHECM